MLEPAQAAPAPGRAPRGGPWWPRPGRDACRGPATLLGRVGRPPALALFSLAVACSGEDFHLCPCRAHEKRGGGSRNPRPVSILPSP